MGTSSNPHVIVLSIAQFLWGGLTALAGLAMAFAGAVFGALFESLLGEWVPGLGAAGAMVFILIGVVIVAVGGFAIMSGVGLLKQRPWGRITTFITAGLAGAGALMDILAMATGEVAFGWVLSGAYAVYAFIMLTRPEVAALFRSGPPAPVARTA